jgi:hypothetical protein
VQLRTAITSGKRRTDLQDSQEDPRPGIREASKWDVQWVIKNDGPDIVDRLNPSETAPTRERERERKRTLDGPGLLKTSALKEGVRVAVGGWSLQPREKTNKRKRQARGKEDAESTTLRKEGTVIHC